MIFKDKLDESHKNIQPEINSLIPQAWENQQHVGDLLLLHINGFFDPTILNYNETSGHDFSPHLIGLGSEGHSAKAHYEYIHRYRMNNIYNLSYSKYLEKVRYKHGNEDEIDLLISDEENIIQNEMLIYLKIWECDLFIKKYYQLIRLVYGESYDWYFKLANTVSNKMSTGTRQNVIQIKIRDRLKTISPGLYNVFKKTYIPQIRNSIAHSNYSFQGRSIHLNNYIKENQNAQLQSISFDEWIEIFHNTLVLYNEYIHLGQLINQHYIKITQTSNQIMEIKITDQTNAIKISFVKYREFYNDWSYLNSDDITD